ncbi:hypothetical protein GE061_002756 [Apolygus lucorum]|uniref:Polycystin domain-containing protein n=1 Tax=Apolygus lucorum TaxID=248454 RepID=A0A8S9XA38_APOLU|nr:hypothetical protein GE061_002756 [Apolygus lucorum]
MESQKRKSVKIADDETDSVESQPEQPKQEQPKQERPKQERPKNAPPDKKKSDDSTASLPPYISINEPVSDIAVPTPRAQPQKQQSTLKHQQPEIMNARDRTMSIVRRNKRRRRQERFGPLMLPEKDRTAEDIRRENLLKNKAWQLTADALRDEKEAYIIFSLRDFIIYLLFLNLLLTVSYGPKENAYNYYGSVMSDLITKSKFTTEIETGNPGSTVNQTFEGVRSIKQLWDFINKIFVTVVYMDPVRNRILMESYFIGMPSIRQVKVKKDTCITAPMFQDLYKTCYNDYSTEIEDKEPFGDPNSYPWKYQSPYPYERANGLKTTYQEGGYIFNFTLDRNFTSEWLAELEMKNWIGPGTRAVVIDFATYTPNTNLFLIVKMLAEVLPEGGIKTSHQFMTIKFMSTYLALVVYGYQQTHLAQDDGGILHQQFIDDLVYSLYINILMFFRLFTLVNSYRAKDESHRSKADYDAFVTMLKRYGWNVKEIKLFLKSFGVRRGVPLDFEELTKIYSDFWLRNQLFVEVEAHSEIREQLNRISKNLEWCELSILDIMSKTDVIADRAMKRSHISQ